MRSVWTALVVLLLQASLAAAAVEVSVFQNVAIEESEGHRATLTIFHDGEEFEQVDLHDFDKEGLQEMMLQKGFLFKPEQEVTNIKEEIEQRKKTEDEGKTEQQLDNEQMKEKILNDAWKSAEKLYRSTAGGEIKNLTEQIKALKTSGGNKAEIDELEKRRSQLLRKQMITGQFQARNDL